MQRPRPGLDARWDGGPEQLEGEVGLKSGNNRALSPAENEHVSDLNRITLSTRIQ